MRSPQARDLLPVLASQRGHLSPQPVDLGPQRGDLLFCVYVLALRLAHQPLGAKLTPPASLSVHIFALRLLPPRLLYMELGARLGRSAEYQFLW